MEQSEVLYLYQGYVAYKGYTEQCTLVHKSALKESQQ